MPVIMTAVQAVGQLIHNGDKVAIGGFANGLNHPEELLLQIEKSFQDSGSPNNLTLLYAAGQGDSNEKGLNHLGHEGLVTKVIGGHWGLVPKLQRLAVENKLAAYNLPQGVISQMFRDSAAGRPGVITHVGLHTFVDPRLQGGKLNQKAQESGELVHLIQIGGEEKLFYPSLPVDVAIIRATYADARGNCSFEREGVFGESVAIAQAARNSGGRVIVQVEKLVESGTLDVRKVRLPGIYVDAVVVAQPQNHMQSFAVAYDPALSGEIRVPVDSLKPLPMGIRKIIARRAAMELAPNMTVNLGIGMPEGVAAVAAEEQLKEIVLTTEAGAVGGIPANGQSFGASANVDCLLDAPAQFDFYDGGGLDAAFLGLAQIDAAGNINVSKFGSRIAGCGGFINITQNAKKVIFCGTFTTGGLHVHVQDERLLIQQEGSVRKFVSEVEHITFSADYAVRQDQPVLYVTERAVFMLSAKGVELKEIAPGVDLQRDILDQMDFIPIMNDVKTMDSRIFRIGKMDLGVRT